MPGDTASSHDFTRQLHNRAPVVLGLVAVLAFVLLLAAFRSVAIPLVSIILNLMSVGAAYGLITLIFQDGRLQGALGYTAFGDTMTTVSQLSHENVVYAIRTTSDVRLRHAA